MNKPHNTITRKRLSLAKETVRTLRTGPTKSISAAPS